MKAVGLDTCVVLRLLTGEPESQAEQAHDYLVYCFHENIRVCISDLVVGETYHALVYHYDVPIAKAVKKLASFLSSSLIASTGYALSVLEDFKGTGAGFIDRLIRMDYLDTSHRVATFDKRMARLEHVFLLK